MREIFNPLQKKAYIDATITFEGNLSPRNYENLFYSISKYESILNEDLSKMNVEQAKSLLVALGMLSASSMVTTITILRSYVQWCIDTKLIEGENPFDKININDIDISKSIKCKLLSSPEHLKSIFESAFPTGSDVEFMEQSQLIAWFFFWGLTPDCIRTMKKSDILYSEKCVINENGEHVPITDEMLSLAKYCSEQVTLDRRDSITTKRIYPLNDNEYLFRTTINCRSDPDAPVGQMLLISRIRSISINYTQNTRNIIELTIDRIYRSGIFYRLYQLEQSGKDINKEIIYHYFQMNYQNETTIMNETRKKMLDYKNWKKAFGI